MTGGSDGKESACGTEDPGSIPGSGRSPGERKGYPLQYSCLENSMNGGVWGATTSPWHCKESDTTKWLILCCTCVLSRVWLFVTLWAVSSQAPLSVGFSRQEYWSGLPFPSPSDLPKPGIKPASPVSPALQADSLPTEPSGNLWLTYNTKQTWAIFEVITVASFTFYLTSQCEFLVRALEMLIKTFV